MEYVKLGSTGLDVSPLCVGCMTFGEPDRGPHPWTLPEDESRPLIRAAIEAGINFFDTANVYSAGSSEEIVGRALAEYGNRDELVIATKVHGRMGDGPNRAGLSRKAIFAECDASLRRLGVDYIDLYQIHRWDSDDADRGDAAGAERPGRRRQGAPPGRLVDVRLAVLQGALPAADPRLAPLRDHAGPLQPAQPRGGAGDVPALRRPGRRGHPVEPAGPRRLTRPWGESTSRSETDTFGKTLYDESTDRVIVDAGRRDRGGAGGVPGAGRAGLGARRNPVVTAPIVGLGKQSHLATPLALELRLTAEEPQRLEDPYVPHPVIGF